ncbi:MAG TPA: UDP-N-acetylmuramate--L-alanine ligase [Oligoflexia bacterium]|nr:UDP-N-acetylmuramate--L-alanine ligase [Oligoflexia bacterium]HMP49329.1 UDP-N-acetylmuramate--L-alanine ligase [Oligoflexia bacterium]
MYNQNQKVHFVGIGGVGMAGIAEVLLTLGYRISGSDVRPSQLTEHLQKLGAEIVFGHSPDNIPNETHVLVKSSAILDDNPELIEARLQNIPIIPRAEMLAELMRMKYGIAVAGSHGKTSTTSMTAKILKELGFDPTVIIGGRVLSQDTGASLGSGQYLIAEADESDGSFCLLRPAIAIVTNIDREHMSHYHSFGALEEAFLSFMNSVPFYGLVVYCGDDPILKRLIERVGRKSLSYGLDPLHDVAALNMTFDGWNSEFDLMVKGANCGRVIIPVPGKHMVSNALAAIAVSLELGAYPDECIQSLRNYPGVARRTERIGERSFSPGRSCLFIDDYGHHPAEIKATLRAIKGGILPKQEFPSRLIVIFQPHRYTRTRELFSEFITAFEDADLVFILPIYAAGETEIEGITGEGLAQALIHPACRYVSSFDDLPLLLEGEAHGNDIIVTMGAGSVGKYSRILCGTSKENDSSLSSNSSTARIGNEKLSSTLEASQDVENRNINSADKYEREAVITHS